MKRINLDNLTESELRDLHREIIMRLNFYSENRRKTQLMAFRIGDRVWFETDQGRMEGLIIRINQKTASINADDGRNWRVSPNFLKKIAGLPEREVSQTNLFHLPGRS